MSTTLFTLFNFSVFIVLFRLTKDTEHYVH
nr:MAG TPA: hypothetical protein [Caudoviricetes sp.]